MEWTENTVIIQVFVRLFRWEKAPVIRRILPGRTNPLPKEGLVVFEIGAARRHYHAPLTRTAYIGNVPKEVSNLSSAIIEAGE